MELYPCCAESSEGVGRGPADVSSTRKAHMDPLEGCHRVWATQETVGRSSLKMVPAGPFQWAVFLARADSGAGTTLLYHSSDVQCPCGDTALARKGTMC